MLVFSLDSLEKAAVTVLMLDAAHFGRDSNFCSGKSQSVCSVLVALHQDSGLMQVCRQR